MRDEAYEGITNIGMAESDRKLAIRSWNDGKKSRVATELRHTVRRLGIGWVEVGSSHHAETSKGGQCALLHIKPSALPLKIQVPPHLTTQPELAHRTFASLS
jgi:hypothetical protein